MKIRTFELERRQSLWENHVDYNLTESGIHPLSLDELLTRDEQETVLKKRLGYGQTNGDELLRERIASLYSGRRWDRDNILVTNGSSEANLLAIHSWLEPGDELIFLLPNYRQMDGLAEAYGIEVKPWWLHEADNWQPRIEELEALITNDTRMIALCTPNNPTGQVLKRSILEQVIDLAQKHNILIYADEVYRGAELSGNETPSIADLYDRAVVCGGLSKAYSLPGLRLGWLAGPEEMITEAWSHRDYTSISSGLVSQFVAEKVLQPNRRNWILERNRKLLNDNLAFFKAWMQQQNNRFQFVDPQAGGIVFCKYDFDMSSTDLTEDLRKKESVFLVAGDCFGLDQYLRIGIGAEPGYFKEGLRRFSRWLEKNTG